MKCKASSPHLASPVEKQQKPLSPLWTYGVDLRNLQLLPTEPWVPPVDTYEKKDEFVFVMELAGIEEKDLKIHLDGNPNDGWHLVISGRRTSPIPSGVSCVHRIEIGYGQFERRLRVPDEGVSGEFKPRFESGYLLIALPRRLRS